ncbi:MAG: response regulator transcription factor [Clostridia bacterium]|nr:response regulator transcription factor [Clostridia bacterium]
MSSEQILILEDDIELNRGLCTAFKNDGKSVVSVRTIKSAEEQLSILTPALVLLDINLPDGSGLDLLRRIKSQKPELPVIMLTANDTDDDIVKGFEYGADDYITKPFSLSVLRARVNSKLKKATKDEGINNIADYSFDFSQMKFKKGDDILELSKTEQKILKILVLNKGATVRREDLIDKVWTDGSEYVDDNALSVSVKRLRDKLSTDRIKTVYGIGYSWVNE